MILHCKIYAETADPAKSYSGLRSFTADNIKPDYDCYDVSRVASDRVYITAHCYYYFFIIFIPLVVQPHRLIAFRRQKRAMHPRNTIMVYYYAVTTRAVTT